ncbi:probable L-type lectin-domain containing receptor kinase S.5 [Triticum urartu]|nr:probable L-type lectin-domain containing receptor kinase S.5 [Triticum urartu]XP_048568165.1 probable L-type lectin-domain containing receptor kinase S.5 [Triticum urartu]
MLGPGYHNLLLGALLLLFFTMISSGAARDDVVAYSFATINSTTADGLTVVTNQSQVVSGPTLFGIDHPTLSAVNESAGFVVLSRTVELWRGGDGRQGPPRQASFNTSFTMDGTSPVAFVVLLDRFPTYKGKFISVTTFVSGPGDPTERGSNRFATVEVGTVKSYAPESPRVGLNVTVTPSGATPMVTVWIDYHAVLSRLGVFVAPTGRTKPREQLVGDSAVNLTGRTNQSAFVGFSASRVAYVLSGVRGWDLTVERFSPAAEKDDNKKSWLVILLAVLGSVASTAAVVAAVGFYYNSRYRRWKKDLEQLAKSMQRLPGMPCRIDFSDIKKATKNFDGTMKLGSGTFGSVYRCRLPAAPETGRPEMEVAVKKFTRNDDRRFDDFLEEVSVINRLRHKNIVPLIGWSYHGGEPLLIFELMPNGSLDQHLFHLKTPILLWDTRYAIVRDIATGLHYVHHEYEPAVLHRDIKASNIMLDSTFGARLGDFGIACTVPLDRNSVTGLAGTQGYIAPEYACSYRATRETDIYAFGVVVLEIVTGRRALDRDVPSEGHITDWIWRFHWEGKLLDAMDPVLAIAGFDDDDAKRLMLLGLACTNPNPSNRPSMLEVVQVITKLKLPPAVPPKKPTFVWPPQGWSSYNSYFSTETSTIYASGSSTKARHV